MKSNEIQVGKTYRNPSGVCRRVDAIVDDPKSSGDKNRIVSWVLTHSKRGGQASGACPVYEFAWWAAAEVQLSDAAPAPVVPQTPQETVPPTEAVVAATPGDKAMEHVEGVQQFIEAKAAVGPGDLVCAFTVTLSKEVRNKDLEATVAAIQQIKGVASVTPVRADMQYFIAKDQARRELLTQLREVLKG